MGFRIRSTILNSDFNNIHLTFVFMNEEIKALQEAIALNRENALSSILDTIDIVEIDEDLFQELLDVLASFDAEFIRLNQALESQDVIDRVLKNKLQ